MSNNIKYVDCNFGKLLGCLFSITTNSIFFGFFTKFYNEADNSIKYNYSSILLLIILINSCRQLYLKIIEYFVIITFRGQSILESKFKNMIMFNSKIILIINNLIEQISVFACILSVPIFIPFTKDNCHEYSDGLCVFGRITAFFGIIHMISIGLLLIVLTCFCALINNRERREIIIKFKKASNIPFIGGVVNIINLYDYECPICLVSGEESEDDKFVELPCKHKFHHKCILLWKEEGNNCPICRADINIDLNVSTINVIPSSLSSEENII